MEKEIKLIGEELSKLTNLVVLLADELGYDIDTENYVSEVKKERFYLKKRDNFQEQFLPKIN